MNFFKFIYLFLREKERETERQRENDREKGRERERERIPSRLCRVNTEPNVGLHLTNRKIMT